MKKYFSLAALALAATAFTACSSDSEMNPEVGYGYIELASVTTDAAIETRASDQTVSNFSQWIATVTNTSNVVKYDDVASGLEDEAFAADGNPYKVAVKNYSDLNAALNTNSYWGDAWYNGETSVTVIAGKKITASIDCGTADNARLGVTFDNTFTSLVSENVLAEGFSMKVKKTVTENGESIDKELTFNAGTPADKYVYYNGGTKVNYTLSYTFNNTEKTIEGDVTLGANGTQKTLNVMLNKNGKIELSIVYDKTFTNTTTTITIDGATGDKAQ